MSTYVFIVPQTHETFTHLDMGFTLEEWDALSEKEKQDAAEEHAQELFESICYDLHQQ